MKRLFSVDTFRSIYAQLEEGDVIDQHIRAKAEFVLYELEEQFGTSFSQQTGRVDLFRWNGADPPRTTSLVLALRGLFVSVPSVVVRKAIARKDLIEGSLIDADGYWVDAEKGLLSFFEEREPRAFYAVTYDAGFLTVPDTLYPDDAVLSGVPPWLVSVSAAYTYQLLTESYDPNSKSNLIDARIKNLLAVKANRSALSLKPL